MPGNKEVMLQGPKKPRGGFKRLMGGIQNAWPQSKRGFKRSQWGRRPHAEELGSHPKWGGGDLAGEGRTAGSGPSMGLRVNLL